MLIAYTFDTATGLYSLTNPITAKYSDVYTSLAGKYLALDYTNYEPYTESSNGFQNSNIDKIIKCVEAPYSATASVTFKYNDLVSTRLDFLHMYHMMKHQVGCGVHQMIMVLVIITGVQ
jgi:hypothetical protein